MHNKTIAMYWFLDDVFKAMGRKTAAHGKVTDAQVATTALLGALGFYGNQAAAYQYMRDHQGIKIIDKSGFIACAD